MDDFTRRMMGPRKGSEVNIFGEASGRRETNTSSFNHKAGTYAVWIIPICMVLNVVLAGFARAAAQSVSPVIVSILLVIPGFMLLSAFPAGIIALCGIPKFGTRKLLWKGLVGVLVPVLLIAIAIPAFLKVRKMSEEKKARQQHESNETGLPDRPGK